MDAKYGMYKRCENREEKTSVNKEIFFTKGIYWITKYLQVENRYLKISNM